jgi:hypothetical protein
MKILKIITALLATFLCWQVGLDQYSRHHGPFAYFQNQSGMRDFGAINGLIDRHFETPQTISEALNYMQTAGFRCSYGKNVDIKVPPSNTGHPVKATITSDETSMEGSIGCFYKFGSWLPLPSMWMVVISIDQNGKSGHLLEQRLME